jgi:phospholipase C
MGYFDGNPVTALWNYAQHYAMCDNSYSTYFGPSTVGAIDLISGQTRSGNIDIDIAAGHEVGNFRVAATYNCAHAQAGVWRATLAANCHGEPPPLHTTSSGENC